VGVFTPNFQCGKLKSDANVFKRYDNGMEWTFSINMPFGVAGTSNYGHFAYWTVCLLPGVRDSSPIDCSSLPTRLPE